MIVIAGGSGLLGQQVVIHLLARGEKVRVLVRDPARARALFGDAVEVVRGDVRSRAELGETVAGATVVISAVHGFLGGRGAGPVEVDERGNANLVDAAAAAGAGVVLVSVLGASPDSPVDLFRAKYAAEQHLRGSGTRWTIVRAAAYLETWLTVLTQTAGKSGRPLILGRGDQPIRFVSALDVAAVAGQAALDIAGVARQAVVRQAVVGQAGVETTSAGQVLEIAGQPITMTDLARALQDVRGWHGKARHLPRPALRMLSVLAGPLSPAFARQNRTALAMDTGVLTVDVPATARPERPQQALADVLARFTGR
jgi:uncharacterized protein YbjT (DUF2867 family)